jgi:hypothetical protein
MSNVQLILAAAFALPVALAQPSAAQPVEHVKVGTLECNLAPSLDFVVGSEQRMQCRYLPEGPSQSELYYGMLSTAGLDIGFKAGGRMIWAVLAPTRGYHPGALAGTYEGVSGDVALGPGIGANVLLGGSDRTIALHPLSVEGNVGVNLAVGISQLRLEPAG